MKERNKIVILVNNPRYCPEELENSDLPFVSEIEESTGKEVFHSFYAKKYDWYATARAKQLLRRKLMVAKLSK